MLENCNNAQAHKQGLLTISFPRLACFKCSPGTLVAVYWDLTATCIENVSKVLY